MVLAVLLANDGLAYDDDIVLIAPTSRAMRRMLFTCYYVADDFSIVFNAKNIIV